MKFCRRRTYLHQPNMRRFGRHSRASVMVLMLFGVARPALAQATTTRADSAKRISLFTRDDAYFGAAIIAGTVAFAPFDKRITGELREATTQNHPFVHRVANDVKVVTYPGSLIIGGSLYAIGRLGHWNKVADLGLHGTEAIGLGSVLNDVIKGIAGRARPYAVADTNPRDFQLFRGFKKSRDYSSFPSGHTLAAFAAAAAVTNESGRWWPGAQWYVGPVLYTGAAAVAFERLYDNQHWASDVIMGAGIGIFAGNKVVRYNHRTAPGNRIDRFFLRSAVVPNANGGFSLVWSMPR
ncbi:MAG TPA: phosphatase PAP2 family protein [Gemmatimonadaceae bacterium]